MALTVSPRMRARLDEYGAFHRTRGNEACHFLGIPLIVLGAGGLLGALTIAHVGGWSLSVTEIVLAAVAAFYVAEARLLGVATALAIIVLGELGRVLPIGAALAVFVVGWGVQFVGHAAFEHRSPAFLKNLLHLLVGPAWLMERLVKRPAVTRS